MVNIGVFTSDSLRSENGILIRRQGFDSIFIDVILSEMKWYLNESKKVFLFVPSSQLIVVFILICNE